MIKVICFGKTKEKELDFLIKDYEKRIKKYHKLELIVLEDYKDDDIKDCLKKEKELLLKHIKEKDNIVLLDIEGIMLDSVSFSKFMEKELSLYSNITFVIGSSNGLDEEIKKASKKKISFSKLTFPHGLFRLLLLEQIYRSFKIINNEKYHK